MKAFVPVLCACAAFRLSGQLELPGLLDDPVGDNAPPAIYIPAPERVDGLHSGTNDRETVIDFSPDSQKFIRLMEGNNPFVLQGRMDLRLPNPDNSFMRGPAHVNVGVELVTGERIAGVLRNQPLLVETQVGRMAPLLHDVERLERILETPVFQIELRGGDVITGEVSTAFLQLVQPDGGERRIPASRWRSLAPRDESRPPR